MPNPLPQRTLTILDYSRIVWRGKHRIVLLVIASVVITGLVSKSLPKLYESKASLLPAREEAMGGGITFGGAGGSKGGGGGSSGGAGTVISDAMGKGGASQIDILNVILRSRKMAEAIIEELGLMQYYGTSSMNAAVNMLRAETTIGQNAFKALEVSVLSQDPKMAANIANAYVTQLDRLNKELNISSTKRNRIFIEKRLEEKVKKLDEAETALKVFQTEHRTLEMTGQTEGMMTQAGDLHGQIVGLEVELAALQEYATPNHPSIIQLKAQIEELRRQLDKMEQYQMHAIGQGSGAKRSLSKQFYPSFDEAPTVALQYIRLNRRLKVEESVYGMLVGMLESARIAEAKDLPTVQPMDSAFPAEFPSKPTTLRNVQVAAAVALILGILFTVFLDYLQWLRSIETYRGGHASDVPGMSTSEADGNGNQMEVDSVPAKETERLYG